MSNYKYPTPQLLLKAICDTIRAKTGSNDKIAHQDIPDSINNILTEEEYYEEQIENISSIYTGTNLNFSINNNDIITIPRYKFDYSNLTTINLPKCISIGEEAIANCPNLTVVNLPICTSIGHRAIANCPNLTIIDLPKCTSIEDSAFANCISLTTVNFPECTSIRNSAFIGCTSLTTINLPNCTSIDTNAFNSCTNLTTINLPECTSIGNSAFQGCTSLTTVNLPKCTSIGNHAFYSCTNLTNIILSNNQVVTLGNGDVFYDTPISTRTGYIYVPDNLVDSYKTATNWSTYANQIKPISELSN